MSFKIGDIQIDNSVVVAPMAGISNSAFRVTVKEFGAGLVVCEMISDKGIQFRNEKTLMHASYRAKRVSTQRSNYGWKQRYFS